MKVIRNETGRFADLGTLKSFDLIDVESETYGDIVMAIQHTIELYESRGWHLEGDSINKEGLIQQYKRYKKLLSKLSDYKNHEKTFNGKNIGR